MSKNKYISIRGARLHNLQNVDIDIPRNKLSVVTGVSGSGKSSLAFDTIYAEGQRRFVESLSSYARQFLERMAKPDADSITGIPPAVAIGQSKPAKNPRSTVGTTTEVYDHLRILYARIGRSFCHKCGKEIKKDTPDSVVKYLLEQWDKNDKLMIFYPLDSLIENIYDEFKKLQEVGLFRIAFKDTLEILDIGSDEIPSDTKPEEILVLIDRVVLGNSQDTISRITESVEQAFTFGNRKAIIYNKTKDETKNFSNIYECADCDVVYEEPEPRLFSFNNPHGACPYCQGFGRSNGIDEDLVFPDRAKSIYNDAIHPFKGESFSKYKRQLLRIASFCNVNVNKPVSELTEAEWDVIFKGAPGYLGLDGFFEMLESDQQKMQYRIVLSRYRGFTTCKKCGGSRLRRSARQVFIAGKNIPELIKMPLGVLNEHFQNLKVTDYEWEIASKLIEEIRGRLSVLVEIGLEYLTLDRLSQSLSGGEAQRIKLATSLGSQLVGTLYVLDEPSIGLHTYDTKRLINILYKLRRLGNTVIVVEHDHDIMKAAENIIDIGPGAGSNGGHLLYHGDYEGFLKSEESLTAAYLSGRKQIELPMPRKKVNPEMLIIHKPRQNNLKMDEVRIPLHCTTVVTGVSGSGKSTLVHDIIYAGMKKFRGGYMGSVGHHEKMEGNEEIEYIEMVDQSPIGKSSRSTPATYTKVFDPIRDLFAETQEAMQMGWKSGYFSFNVPGGRCEVCEGEGVIKVDMQFLPDVVLECEACKGTRYKREVRDLRYKGKSIVDILEMTMDEALAFFHDIERIRKKLQILCDVGLGYMQLGQPSTQLSGGEAQRIKLAQHLDAKHENHTMFIFDEPTTGLHSDDISKLLECFRRLTEKGHSVLIIEHNLDVIASADHVVDLGPGPGDKGGMLVAEGSPRQICNVKESLTGQALVKYFEEYDQRNT